MGRPRSFDEGAVLDAAARVFVRGGYEGTSIDDLLTSLNLHRGSLYKAFGSKRGLFLATLRRHVHAELLAPTATGPVPPEVLDLVLVAALERGPVDPEVADLVRDALDALRARTVPVTAPEPLEPVFALLGGRLHARLHPDGPTPHDSSDRPQGVTAGSTRDER